MKFTLCAIDPALVNAWNNAFAGVAEVTATNKDIFTIEADAIVSPANSFGFMDGGFDWLLTQRFGIGVQKELQQIIQREYGGELLVGQAVPVPTADPMIRNVISAPTMRVPMILGTGTVNPYLAMKAIIQCAKKYKFKHVTMTGLGTGVGKVPAQLCANQMRQAWNDVVNPAFPKSWNEAQVKHQLLYTTATRDLQKS